MNVPEVLPWPDRHDLRQANRHGSSWPTHKSRRRRRRNRRTRQARRADA